MPFFYLILFALCALHNGLHAADEPNFYFKNKSTDYNIAVILNFNSGGYEKMILRARPEEDKKTKKQKTEEMKAAKIASEREGFFDLHDANSIEIGYWEKGNDQGAISEFYKFPLSGINQNTKLYLKFEGIDNGIPILSPQKGGLFSGKTEKTALGNEYSLKNNITDKQIREPVRVSMQIQTQKPSAMEPIKTNQKPQASWESGTAPKSTEKRSDVQIGKKKSIAPATTVTPTTAQPTPKPTSIVALKKTPALYFRNNSPGYNLNGFVHLYNDPYGGAFWLDPGKENRDTANVDNIEYIVVSYEDPETSIESPHYKIKLPRITGKAYLEFIGKNEKNEPIIQPVPANEISDGINDITNVQIGTPEKIQYF